MSKGKSMILQGMLKDDEDKEGYSLFQLDSIYTL